MAMQKPLDLVRFISNIPVLNDGTIPLNTMDGTNSGFTSTMFTPVYSLSALARMVQKVLNRGDEIELVNIDLDPSTIVYQVLNSDLASHAPDIYLLARAVVLESFSLLYSIEIGSANLQYVSSKDFDSLKENINYLADYLSSDKKYYGMIDSLRTMNISLGYIENQVGVIMNDKGVI